MNFKKFINSDYLKNNPLCGISTYKDTLNLATGVSTRQIKKLVLTGSETWSFGTSDSRNRAFLSDWREALGNSMPLCTHYNGVGGGGSYPAEGNCLINSNGTLIFNADFVSDKTEWITYLQQQYAAGTPVCVWYILATPTTETITVPSGLSGIEEGYLNQNGTPTPTNPIYPTANTVEKWFDIPHYIHNTSTDTLTTLPADIYANDNNATVGLKGDMEQSGTPTPTTPIQPQECGDLTGNLFDATIEQGTITISGDISADNRVRTREFINVESEYITLSWNSSQNTEAYIMMYDANGDFIRGESWATSPTTQQLLSTVKKIRIIWRYNPQADISPSAITNVMVNTGSTPLPYEPYGQYKIPILSAGQTTPVYLGEVESTRRIKKLVLTGEEEWTTVGTADIYGIAVSQSPITSYAEQMCSHFISASNWAEIVNNDGKFGISSPQNQLVIHYNTSGSIPNFKSFLQQQYANGTPVTIWYALATPQTAVVNEPLRKIGTYADEVANVSIPVIAGANTISVGTTIQPSEVSVNYHGWHPIADIHEAENGQWD